MTVNKNIPKHWQIVKVGEYVISVKGKKPKRVSPIKTRECTIPYVNIKAFEKNVIDEYTDGLGCILCEDDDFLMVWDGSRSGYVGKAIKGALGSTLMKLKFPNIDINYAYYFLQSKYIEINTRAKGVGIPHVDPNILWNYNLPIPPLPEQQLIVSKIEELLSDLDNGKQQLLTAQQQLKVYRQSLLKWLYDKSFGSVPVKLIDVCDFITKGTTPSKDKLFNTKGDVPFLKVYNLTFNGTIDFSKDPTFVDHETHNVFLKRSIVYPNDVLMNIVGPPLGKVSIVPSTFSEWNINQAMVRFRCKEKLFNKYLLYFLLCENTIRTYSRKAKATAGQFNLTLEICRDIEIPLPSIKEQQLIIDLLESKLAICDKIEETISQSLLQAETLRQSILKKAFEGKLVSLNYDSDDELDKHEMGIAAEEQVPYKKSS